MPSAPIIDNSYRAFAERDGCDLTESERQLGGYLTASKITGALPTVRLVAQCCEAGGELRKTMNAAIEIMEIWHNKLSAGAYRAEKVIDAKRSAGARK